MPSKYTSAECSVEPVKADMLQLQLSEGARPPKVRSEMQLAVITLATLVRHIAVLCVSASHARVCANSGERQDPSPSAVTSSQIVVWLTKGICTPPVVRQRRLDLNLTHN